MSLRAGDRAAAFARERELWEAFRRRDRAALERLIDPLALDVGPGGTRTRERLLADAEHVTVDGFALDGVSVAESDATSVVAYCATVEGTYRGVPFHHPRVAVSSIWVRDGEAWRLAHRCEIPVPGSVT